MSDFLCIGDLHIKPSNIYLIDLLETQIIRHIQSLRIHSVIILGDVLNTFERLHTMAVNRAYTLIDRIRAQCTRLFILVGNHDFINNQQFQSDEHWMNALKKWDKVIIVDRVQFFDDHQFGFCPFLPTGRFNEAVLPLLHARTRIVFAHQEFRGCKMGAIESTEGDIWDAHSPLIISGHIHEKQRPQENIFYIGAAVQNAFGDAGTPILLHIETNGELKFSEIPIELPKKRSLFVSHGELTLDAVDAEVKRVNTDLLRIVYHSSYEEFKIFCKSLLFEQICSYKTVRVVHKMQKSVDSGSTPTSISGSSNGFDFIGALERMVLERQDESLYSIFALVVYNSTIDPANILIV